MAKAKKSTLKRKRTASTLTKSQSVRGMRRSAATEKLGRFAMPLVISMCLLAGIVFLTFMGYQTATASYFFGVRTVDIRGVERAPQEDIRRIVTSNTEKSGVWRADLPVIREKIEKLPFVKSAAVSMSLPAGIRVNVIERVPQAIVRMGGGDYLVDSEGVVLAPAAKTEASLPFVMRGWDETKSAKAPADNLARIKLYKKMLDEWSGAGIADRVKEIDIGDLRDPSAVIEDSGRPIMVTLARDDLAKSLRSAIEAVAGKGSKVKAVNAGGVYPIIEYMGN